MPYCDCFAFVPLLRAYHAETGNRVPFGTYLGASPIPQSETDAFYSWVAAHAAELRPAWDDFFNWDGLLERYGAAPLIVGQS